MENQFLHNDITKQILVAARVNNNWTQNRYMDTIHTDGLVDKKPVHHRVYFVGFITLFVFKQNIFPEN